MALSPIQPSLLEEEPQAGEPETSVDTPEDEDTQELHEKMHLLRSIVPASEFQCGSWSIDLAMDVSQYVERIEKEIRDLAAELQPYGIPNTSSRDETDCKCQNKQGSAEIQVNATADKGGIKIYARYGKKPGVMEMIVKALEALDLTLVDANVKCCSCNHMIMEAFGLQDQKKVRVQPVEVEHYLMGALAQFSDA